MRVCSYRKDGILRVQSSKGTVYEYVNVSDYVFNRVQWFLKKGFVGRAWNILKPFYSHRINRNEDV
jgi:hypothetical protein